ncbi:MAG: biopolymer transporter ExbD [Flavobacterium sp.]|nr:biopolymer transporter ExbD [Flavobacterium sp.]
MAIRRKKRFHAEIPTSSLSDIMFFLLLFFLIISTLANPNVIKLMLPKAQTNETTHKNHISLSVTESKQYFLDKQEVSFDQLKAELQRITTDRNDKTVVVRIPKDLQVQDLVDVLQIGSELKLNFSIATSK